MAILVLRVTMGAVFLAHGWPKAFAAADAEHGSGRIEQLFVSKGLPRPALLASLVGYAEVVGGAFVLIGLVTRIAVVPLVLIVAGAIPAVKWKRGFVDGWDWPLTLVAMGIALLLLGGGSLSVDALLGIPH